MEFLYFSTDLEMEVDMNINPYEAEAKLRAKNRAMNSELDILARDMKSTVAGILAKDVFRRSMLELGIDQVESADLADALIERLAWTGIVLELYHDDDEPFGE